MVRTSYIIVLIIGVRVCVCIGLMGSMWCLEALSREWTWYLRSRATVPTAERHPRRSSLLTVGSCDWCVGSQTQPKLLLNKKLLTFLVSFVNYIIIGVSLYQFVQLLLMTEPQRGLWNT